MDADVRIVLESQHTNGAYVASPAYAQYPYCWLRDGSFIAHAMDAVGQRESAGRFHAWVAKAVLGIEPAIRAAVAAFDAGEAVDHDRMPPARFTLDGRVEDGGWPNFQVDGYGQWLWSLEEHVRRGYAPRSPSGVPAGTSEGHRSEPMALDADLRKAVELIAEYLIRFWSEPCYDAWEEGRTQHHTSTLASACAGLRAAVVLLGAGPVPYGAERAHTERFAQASGSSIVPSTSDDRFARRCAMTADEAWSVIRARCTIDGRFRKGMHSDSVDASLVWMATPFRLVDEGDPTFSATVDRIERDLVRGGGVVRYPEDTFYGGGAWVLLTAWLAWHHARAGRLDRAESYLAWVEAQRDAEGGLPEQVRCPSTDPWFHRWWTRRWGPSASPLLWSHAMALLARTELNARRHGT